MAEQPALHRIHVIGYAANDRDFPTVALVADPRVAGYQVPKDLSVCPDKRYPNHVFTGAQPIAGDQRVRHVWEILPSPWVPFTRYDDDLGPVQGRRRSVKNEGQIASLTSDKRTTYEAREGSAIVYTEIEENWSIKTDEDGNSLFPIRDRDFYDPSRGPVQERRQLFVPTGEEEGSLENVNGIITQTSYEPYNEFLSVKIVQTYKVDGPQLIGRATNNEGQLVTVTTQRKASDGYSAPSPTATRTVEASREDAESLVERIVDTPEVFDNKTLESLVERIVDTPEVFDNKTLSASKPEILPERFRASITSETTQEIVEQSSVQMPTLENGELEKTEERVTKFTVRKSTTSRDISSTPTLSGMDYEESFDVQIPYTEKVQQTIPTGSAEAAPLDDQNFLVREYDADDIESYLSSFLQTYPTTINMDLPRVLESVAIEWDEKQQSGSYENEPFAGGILYQYSSNDRGEASSFHSATPLVSLNFKDVWSKNIPATVHIFFLKNPVTEAAILEKTNSAKWPTFKPKSHVITGKGVEIKATAAAATSVNIQQSKPAEFGIYADQSKQRDFTRSITPITINIPPCLHGSISINQTKTLTASINVAAISARYPATGPELVPSLVTPNSASISDEAFIKGSLSPTVPADIPSSGIYLIDSSVEFFKYGFSIVRATTIDAGVFA